jgi:hypothetical protein
MAHLESQNMSDKQSDAKKMIDKMRTNTEKQQRKTVLRPLRRSRVKVPKSRQKDEPEKPA